MRFRCRPSTAIAVWTFVILPTACSVVNPAAAQDAAAPPDETLEWIAGPATCELGHVARLELPAGYQFTGKEGTRSILESMGNPTDGSELGLVTPEITDDSEAAWFVVFEYNPIGYVRDTDKDQLDADAIFASIREGTEASNKYRRENGWPEMQVVGWRRAPFYDERTHNLTWAIIGSADGMSSVNYAVRLLGRGGAMSADLVIDPEHLDAALPEFNALIAAFSFTPTNDYAAFREGDKVAKYGLTALVAGGAGAVAMKTGLLARFWKFIVIGVVALAGSLRRFVGRLMPRRKAPGEPDRTE